MSRSHASVFDFVVPGVLALLIFPAFLSAAPQKQADVIQTSRGPLRITPIFHASVMLEFDGKVLYVDPGRGEYVGLPQADVILVTHTHDDHLDKAMIERLKKPSATIGGTPAVLEAINCRECSPVALNNGERKTVAGVEMEGIPMYNVAREGREARHPKGLWGGFILTFGDARVYFSGDTDCTPEMKGLRNITAAFVLGINSAAETAQCVKEFRPKIFYPYHHRQQKAQEIADAFKDTPEIEVRLRRMEAEQ